MEIKSCDGYVTYRMRTGGDYVLSKMTVARAEELIESANEKANRVIDGEKVIAIDDTYFFPIASSATRRAKGKQE